MSNPLTGDFDAVLQVSGATVNRLVATMHQNAESSTDLPRFPHTIWFRLGDDRAYDGVRGWLNAQLGVPRIELLDGATDRFVLEVGVRALFKADPGTKPLPPFIHGTVRAEYRLQSLDHCRGWAQKAGNYLWFRVVRDSVRFQGTAEEDANPLMVSPTPAPDPAAINARITKQIARLLATRFAPKPHPVSKHFKQGKMRCLHPPLGDSAVVMPVGLHGDPVGNIDSVANLILDRSDFAIAVTRDYILSLAEPALAAISDFHPTIGLHVHVSTPWPAPDIDVSTVYRVHVDPPSVDWQPHGSFAVIKIKVSGSAKTDSILPNASFDIDQDLVVNFDAAGEVLWLSEGSRTVTAHASGIGSGIIAAEVKKAVNNAVKPIVQAACTQEQPSLDAMLTRKGELVDQLKTLDDQSWAAFDEALFLADGLVVRGTIGVARRRSAVVAWDKTLENDGFTAVESWIPGGRIDSLEWSWTWAGSGTPGSSTWDDRFLLRRPPGKSGRWGLSMSLAQPLPGIDGSGSICLRIRGVQVDAQTGQLVPVESIRRCRRYGINVSVYAKERLFLRDVPELSKDVPFPQLALVATEVGDRGSASNTLLVYVDREWDDEIASTLREAVAETRREDAGLMLLVLFREGVLDAEAGRLIPHIEEIGRELGVFTVVNEDVRGGWATRYAFSERGEPSWRLLSPSGGVTWMHQGRVRAKELANALDHALIPSPTAGPTPLRGGATVGARLAAEALFPGYADLIDEADAECPPLPLGRLGVGEAVVAFVQAGSKASDAELRRLATEYGQRDPGPTVIVVVDGADDRAAERLKIEHGADFVMLADRRGTVTDRLGVRIWPTTMTIDGNGVISAVDLGARRGLRRTDHPADSAE